MLCVLPLSSDIRYRSSILKHVSQVLIMLTHIQLYLSILEISRLRLSIDANLPYLYSRNRWVWFGNDATLAICVCWSSMLNAKLSGMTYSRFGRQELLVDSRRTNVSVCYVWLKVASLSNHNHAQPSLIVQLCTQGILIALRQLADSI